MERQKERVERKVREKEKKRKKKRVRRVESLITVPSSFLEFRNLPPIPRNEKMKKKKSDKRAPPYLSYTIPQMKRVRLEGDTAFHRRHGTCKYTYTHMP